MKKNTNSKNEPLLTVKDELDVFGPFRNDKDRIKYVSRAYKHLSIAKAFEKYYGLQVSQEVKRNWNVNDVIKIEIGKIYTGTVKQFNDKYMLFEVPGVKDEIISKEALWCYAPHINNYLLNHNNQLMFEVREQEQGKYYVSVLNAYYRKWMEMMENAMNGTKSIDVHIDQLVNGGYVCNCDIAPLTQLTGQKFTSSVFIPGSHIVLNIENDFERWVGQDVSIIPQKFVDFKVDKRTGTIEKSLVGSRKRVLQLLGNFYLYEMYNLHKLGESEGAKFEKPSYMGTVTGIINSGKKVGVFVEINDKYITGLLPLSGEDLLDYKPGDQINIRIAEFEVQPEKEPFIIKNDEVVKCFTRPVFELA